MSSVENIGSRKIYIVYCPSLRFYIVRGAVLIPFTKDAGESKDKRVRKYKHHRKLRFMYYGQKSKSG